MTESEWLEAISPAPLLEHVKDTASDRKLRLFGCALYRRRWPSMRGCSGRLVELAEQFADGQIEEKQRRHAWARFGGYGNNRGRDFDALVVASASRPNQLGEHPYCWMTGRLFWPIGRTDRLLLDVMHWFAQGLVQESAMRAKNIRLARSRLSRFREWLRRWTHRWPRDQFLTLTRRLPMSSEFPPVASDWSPEELQQSHVVRDLFGNPFRPLAIEPAWSSWNDRTVPRIARRIYAELRFHDMPVLADALEDAGCTNEDVLAHLRGPGPHVRGCWVLDLLLGKE